MKLDRQSAYQPESGTCGMTGDLDEDSADDELNMGMPGEKYTKADGRLLAKYIATVEDWKNKDDSERFENFHRRVSFFLEYNSRRRPLFLVPSQGADLLVTVLPTK